MYLGAEILLVVSLESQELRLPLGQTRLNISALADREPNEVDYQGGELSVGVGDHSVMRADALPRTRSHVSTRQIQVHASS